mmetsp:Transcript_31529/g.73448  ORF Transcript_31529/g.73448 Transcript_31529/m.73448 type:complete len:266 (-) Transcript_31529:2-799(-)
MNDRLSNVVAFSLARGRASRMRATISCSKANLRPPVRSRRPTRMDRAPDGCGMAGSDPSEERSNRPARLGKSDGVLTQRISFEGQPVGGNARSVPTIAQAGGRLVAISQPISSSRPRVHDEEPTSAGLSTSNTGFRRLCALKNDQHGSRFCALCGKCPAFSARVLNVRRPQATTLAVHAGGSSTSKASRDSHGETGCHDSTLNSRDREEFSAARRNNRREPAIGASPPAIGAPWSTAAESLPSDSIAPIVYSSARIASAIVRATV